MAVNTFDLVIPRLLSHEGGYSNHPSDPGGPTNYGITITDYRLYINKNGTASDVRNLKKSQAIEIYKEKYWNKMLCDDLEAGLDYTIFDLGVNSGVGRSAEFLRKATNYSLSPKTITFDLVQKSYDFSTAHLINKINDLRMDFLQRLRTWPVFGRGWSRRVTDVRKYSLELAELDGI